VLPMYLSLRKVIVYEYFKNCASCIAILLHNKAIRKFGDKIFQIAIYLL
jgi:hypothetical protein